MTTIDEINTLSNDVVVEPSETRRQDYEIVNPVGVEQPVASTLSKDQSSNDAKEETIHSFYAKWRYDKTFTIETSAALGDLLFTESSCLDTLFAISTLSNTSIKSVLNPEAVYRSYALHTYAGVRFDLELKFTIYSSNQQQGALIFSYFPNCAIDSGNVDFVSDYYLGADSLEFVDLNGTPAVTSHTFTIYTQLPHKIISFGAETEVIMRIPFNTKYDFIPIGNFSNSKSWGAVMCNIFDPLVVRSGTYDKVSVRVERRIVNLKLIGPSFTDTNEAMGSYYAGT